MEEFLCDELIQEIFQRLPYPISSSTASLVCKRWLHLHRASITSLSLRVNGKNSSSIPSFLARYPHLSSLTIISSDNISTGVSASDHLLLRVASNCSNLHLLRFFAGPVSPSSLISLSSLCKNLTCLHVSSCKSLSFRWLINFPFLKELSFANCSGRFEDEPAQGLNFDFDSDDEEDNQSGSSLISPNSPGLPLETLCLSGIGGDDRGLGWLWRNCRKLKKLQLRGCESVGDGDSYSSFFRCLKGLEELELRTSRPIVDWVLNQLSEHCVSLSSLVLYDGGSRDGLHRFITQTRSTTLQRLDFRLPLDLDNDHLSAIAENFRSLVTLRLQSCCLVTGEGLKNLGSAINGGLEELALINCDVVEREPGLLNTLGQNLRGLRCLDLSYNEMLVDKEFVSMIVSSKGLIDIKLRGCRKLTNSAIVSMFKNCKCLESVDIKQCSGIGAEAVEVFLVNSPMLRRVQVEESKLSDVSKTWVFQKSIEVN